MTAAQPAHIRHFGTGLRRALALHCTLAHGGAWKGVAAALSGQLALTAPDLPSHGLTADWDGQGSYDDACLAVLQPLLETPVDLIGHSFGATVALRLAMENPGRVRSLTLIEPVFFAALRACHPEMLDAYKSQAAPCQEALARGDMTDAARLFNRIWGDGRKWDDLAPSARRYMAGRIHLIDGQDASLVQDHAGLLEAGRLERLALPVLLIEGDQSPEVIARIHDALAGRIPNIRRVTIEGAGHMCPITHPQAVARAISALLEMA